MSHLVPLENTRLPSRHLGAKSWHGQAMTGLLVRPSRALKTSSYFAWIVRLA